MAHAQKEATKPSAASIPSVSEAASYESEHVHKVYSSIAPHFATTRHAPWPKVNDFLQTLPAHSLVADIGCGNGKYMAVLNELPLYGIATDFCAGLVEYANTKSVRYDTGVADALQLPFRTGVFDASISIAMLHHFATMERRVSALKENIRILRRGGTALFYVWALERPSVPKAKHGNRGAKMLSRRFETQDVFVPWHMRTKKEGASSEKILGDWHDVHHRFYHVYKKGELEIELRKLDNIEVVDSYYDHQNWCCVVQKV